MHLWLHSPMYFFITDISIKWRGSLMQRRCVEAESIIHKYYNSSTKFKFYKNTRLIGKIIEKTSLAKFYSKNTHNINNQLFYKEYL